MLWKKKTDFGKRREKKPVHRNAVKKKSISINAVKKTLFLSIIKFLGNSTIYN